MMDIEKQQGDAQHLGELLKKAREKSEQSVAEIANQLHLKQSFVNALESGDYQVIDSMVYVKGYLRIYARLLQINIDHEMAFLELEVVHSPKVKTQHARVSGHRDKMAKLNKETIKRTVHQKKYSLLGVIILILLLCIWLARLGSNNKPLRLPTSSSVTSVPLELTHQALSLPPSTLLVHNDPVGPTPNSKASEKPRLNKNTTLSDDSE